MRRYFRHAARLTTPHPANHNLPHCPPRLPPSCPWTPPRIPPPAAAANPTCSCRIAARSSSLAPALPASAWRTRPRTWALTSPCTIRVRVRADRPSSYVLALVPGPRTRTWTSYSYLDLVLVPVSYQCLHTTVGGLTSCEGSARAPISPAPDRLQSRFSTSRATSAAKKIVDFDHAAIGIDVNFTSRESHGSTQLVKLRRNARSFDSSEVDFFLRRTLPRDRHSR
jgi:hypothetical protein